MSFKYEIDIYNALWGEWRNVDTVFTKEEIVPAVKLAMKSWGVSSDLVKVYRVEKKEMDFTSI